MSVFRRLHLRMPDALAAAAVLGALLGVAATALLAPAHPALVVTSDAATAVGIVAALRTRLDDVLVRLVAALDVAVLAVTYTRELGAVTSVSMLLATLLIAAPAGARADG